MRKKYRWQSNHRARIQRSRKTPGEQCVLLIIQCNTGQLTRGNLYQGNPDDVMGIRTEKRPEPKGDVQMIRTITLLLAMTGLLLAAGCEACVEPEPAKPVAKASPAPPCEECGEASMRTVREYLPGGKKDCATILVEKTAPEWVQVGQAFDYHIKLTNVSDATLKDVKLWDQVIKELKVTEADPQVSRIQGNWHVWDIGTLDSGDSQTVKLRAMATGECVLNPCAEVTYRMEQVCTTINVVQPSLQITKDIPSERLVCDTIPVTLVVKNVGTGQACNVIVTDPLPDGLSTMDNKKVLTFAAGTLNAGESRSFEAQLKASQTGTYQNKAVAEADGGLRAESNETTTVVTKPDLSVAKTGPEMRYVGRPVTYQITVLNGPEATAENTVLTDTLPAGATFISASEGGNVQGNKVVWNLGTLKPRDSRTVSVTVKSDKPTTLNNAASVTATCGEASGSATTEVRGIPAILLEVVDLEDPIEVGNNVTYEITVTNQGSAMGTNIDVKAMLPQQQSYADSMGPTDASVEGRTINFAPLKTLDPGAKAVYRVTAKVNGTGDVRFRVTMNSDQLTEIVEETEATRQYE